MNVRNLLNQGDFAIPIPMGIHLTLQYNASGNLEKIYTGYTSNRVDRTGEMMNLIIQNSIVPAKIHITKGTSWVYGVLYTNEIFPTTGKLPEASEANLLGKFQKHPEQFNFFAGSMESTAMMFRGATAVRQCLSIAKFRLLPGWLVPYDISEQVIQKWLDSPQYTFVPLITDFMVYHNDTMKIFSTDLRQFVVTKIARYVDINGYVKATVEIQNSSEPFYIDYSDIVRLEIHTGSIIVFDTEQKIIYCKNTKKYKPYEAIINCPYCGKQYGIPKSGSIICPNLHCSSRLRQSIVQFLEVLHLPQYGDGVITDWLKSSTVTCIPDLLLLNEYKDITIQISISDLLRALVPVALIPHDGIFTTLAVACMNNTRTFLYYVNNPTKISSDLKVRHSDLGQLITWLSDGCNATDIHTLLNSSQIQIVATKKKFDGAPIFRNKTIYLTGIFIRGSIGEIASILQSYSATVTTQFSNIVDCVLVGGTQEEIDGKSIRDAKALKKPIFNENAFFQMYEIDDDLRANHIVTI